MTEGADLKSQVEGPEILVFLPNGSTLAAHMTSRQSLSFMVEDIGLVRLRENGLGFDFHQIQFMPENAEFFYGSVMCITEILEPLKTAYQKYRERVRQTAASR